MSEDSAFREEDTEAQRKVGVELTRMAQFLVKAGICQVLWASTVTCISLFSPRDSSVAVGNSTNYIEQMRNQGSERVSELPNATARERRNPPSCSLALIGALFREVGFLGTLSQGLALWEGAGLLWGGPVGRGGGGSCGPLPHWVPKPLRKAVLAGGASKGESAGGVCSLSHLPLLP